MVELPPNYFYDLPDDLQHAIYACAYWHEHRAAFASTLVTLNSGAAGGRLRELAERLLDTSFDVPFGSAHAMPIAVLEEDAFWVASSSTCGDLPLDYLARASMYQRRTDMRQLMMAIYSDREQMRERRQAGVDANADRTPTSELEALSLE